MKKRVISLCLACVLLISLFGSMPVYASSDLEEIQKQQIETQQEIDEAAQKKQEALDEAAQLEEETENLQNNYDLLYGRLSDINKKIAAANESIANTEKEITALEEELEEAKAAEQTQYEAMKERMVYFYENGTQVSLFSVFLTSGSISEFLKRAAMVSEIITYDRQLLESYQELQEVIASKSVELAQKADELQGFQDNLSASQDEMGALFSEVSSDLTAKNSELEDAQDEAAAYDAKIAELKDKMEALESQAAEAQAAAAKAIADQLQQEQDSGTAEDTSGAVSATDSDLIMLAATIQAEADNQSYEGKLAVGSVIMNRVNSSKFPNTISGVITQTNQFASYSSGMVSAIMAKGPNDTCKSIAQEVINGKRNGNWLFFMTKAYADKFGITGYTQIGDHVFFLIWGANTSSESSTTETTTESASTETTTESTETTDETSEETTEEENSE